MTTNPINCPQCGRPLPANAPAGLCPRCVMAMNMAAQTEFTGEVGPHGTKVLTQAPSPEELAAKFPQLEILELLGRGGMGAVYKARQKELDRIVALKILPPGIGETPGFAERFTREARALAKLNHPNIVTLFEFGRADGLFFFLMEYVDGVNLRQLLQGSRISPHEALAIVPQICDALQFAHDHGIVHRDIKPDNILMDRRGRVKVADFGLAKIVGTDGGSVSRSASATGNVEETPGEAAAGHSPALHELTEAGKVMGTPQYMAPEQKDRPLEVDHRADIYALGVVFYQMLTGELPGQRLEPPSKKVSIDVRLDKVVLRAMEQKPELRYQQASLFKTQVEAIASTSAAGELIKKHPPAKHSAVARIWTWVGLVNVQLVTAIFLWFATGKAFSLPVAILAAVILATLFDFLVMGSNSVSGTTKSGEATQPPAAPAERHRGRPKLLWLPISLLALSILSKVILLATSRLSTSSPLLLGDIVFQMLMILGVWFRFRLAYVAIIVGGLFIVPAFSRIEPKFAALGLLLTVGIIVPMLWSTRWFFPAEMPVLRRRAWLLSASILGAVALVAGLAIPPSAIMKSPSNGRMSRTPASAEAQENSSSFGSAIQQVVESGIDFDTSKRRHLPVRDGDESVYDWFNGKESLPWMRQHGIDAVNGNHALMSKDLVLVKLEKNDWDTLAPDELRQRILEQAPATDSFTNSSSRTFGFKTREGGIGIVQMLEDRYAPGITNTMLPGVKIRYKLVRNNLAESGLAPKTQFAARLPDGSFVELVCLMYGSKPRRAPGQTNEIEWFWNPDGTPSEENIGWSFGPSTLSSTRDPALEYRKLVARWGGPDTNHVRLMGWQLDDNPPDNADGQFTVTPKGESAENWIGLAQGFPQDQKTATIRFALASGPYVSGPSRNVIWATSAQTPYGSFSIGKVFDHHGNAAVTLTHNLKGCDYRLQTTMPEPPKPNSWVGGMLWEWKQESRRGKQFQPVYGRMVKGGAFNGTWEFPGVPAKEPRIWLEVRPVQWVEFRDVALNPGEETRVQIRANNAAATANDSVAFGPVMERTINDIDEKLGQECLSLESGKLINFNETEIKALPKAEQAQWFDDRGVNVLMDTVGGKHGLGLRHVTVTLVSDKSWDWDRGALEKAIRPNAPGVDYKDRGGFRWHQIATNAPLPMTFALRTSSGRLGVLQVLTFTDDPGGVKIRYKLVQNDRAANGEELESAFGPVVERVLPDPDNGSGKGNRETLNLITGEQSSILDEAPKEQGGRLRALVASEGDLFAEYDDFVGKRWAFVAAGLKLSDFPTRPWDTATVADVNEALKEPTALQRVEHSGATLYLLPDGLLPLTLAFESRQGARGLLQVTALNDNPHTVTIRYKLVQKGTAASPQSGENKPSSLKSDEVKQDFKR